MIFPCPGPLIGENNQLYGIFVSYYPDGRPAAVDMPIAGECLAPINKGNLFLNVAAPEIFDIIDEILGRPIGPLGWL